MLPGFIINEMFWRRSEIIEIMKNLFVPYELAVAAKEHGFSESCLAGYSVRGELLMQYELQIAKPETAGVDFNKFNLTGAYIQTSAPTYQQLADWFRTKHHLEITVHTESNVNEILGYYAILYGPMSWPVFRIRVEADEFDYYKTWDEALINAFSTLKKP